VRRGIFLKRLGPGSRPGTEKGLDPPAKPEGDEKEEGGSNRRETKVRGGAQTRGRRKGADKPKKNAKATGPNTSN